MAMQITKCIRFGSHLIRALVQEILSSIWYSLKNSLRRSISHRGCPDNVISDNASNFVAIEAQNFAGNLNIKWHFNLDLAPCQWKFFKRLVRSVKELLRKDLRNYKITFSWKITNCKQFYLK